MADEPVTITPTPGTPSAPVVAAPVEASPPATSTVEAPTQVAEGAATATETPKVETVLAEAIDKTKPEVKPEPVKEATEAPKAETTEVKSDEPAPAPVYEAFKVPEGMTLDQERVTKFTELLTKLELDGKADHSTVQKFGQEAVDFHISEVQKATTALNDLYKQAWDRQKTEWKDTFLKDPEIGGNRFQSTVDAALNFIRTHGGTSDQQTEFRNLMETSGLGNHPAMIRMLANAGRAMSEGGPVPGQKPVPTAKSKTQTLYGNLA